MPQFPIPTNPLAGVQFPSGGNFNTTPGYWSSGNPGMSNGGFGTGYPGAGRGNSGIGTPLTNPFGQQNGIQDILDAIKKSEGFANQGLARLAPGQFSGGQLGQGAQRNYLNPQGMSPQALEQLKVMLTSTLAGGKSNAQRNFMERANAAGFKDSMGAVQGAANLDQQFARELSNQLANVDFQNEQYKLTQSGQGGQLAGLLAQLEAALARDYAGLQMNRQVPIVPGGTDGRSGGTGPGTEFWMLDQNGNVNYQPPGGWSPTLYSEMQRQRMAWEARNRRAA